jgi:Na+/H+ antiporter NhaA
MAFFIANLALSAELLDAAKVGILVGSLVSAIAGVTLLITLLPKRAQ